VSVACSLKYGNILYLLREICGMKDKGKDFKLQSLKKAIFHYIIAFTDPL
jgi:hypothetical protein